ncbi:hypothetical protein pb186bvf_017091 [Paramecium bursaria]
MEHQQVFLGINNIIHHTSPQSYNQNQQLKIDKLSQLSYSRINIFHRISSNQVNSANVPLSANFDKFSMISKKKIKQEFRLKKSHQNNQSKLFKGEKIQRIIQIYLNQQIKGSMIQPLEIMMANLKIL